MLMKPAPPRPNHRIIPHRTPHNHLPRPDQKVLIIALLQQPPIAKMRKQMHKQFPRFGVWREEGVVVFEALHEEVELDFGVGAGVFGGGGSGCDEG